MVSSGRVLEGHQARNHLEGILKERITRERLVTYETFVEAALFDERYGYYRTGKRDGKDYFTSPEIHAAFGRTIGRYVDELRASTGAEHFAIVELGGASGRLARDILSSLSSLPERYVIIEKGPEKEEGPIRWMNGVDCIGPLPDLTVVLANEFFDALPFHRILNRDGTIQEICLGYDQGFYEETGPLSEKVASFLMQYPVPLPPGCAAEVTLRGLPIIERLSLSVKRGCFIIFDYGYHGVQIEDGSFTEGSIMAYRSGSIRASVFEQLGETDITHHVNFDHLASMLENRGWRKEGEIEQYRFLIKAGIIDEFAHLPTEERLSAKWLINPEGLGSMISVLGFTKGLSARLPCFGRRV
jgi:SAM-dependent MidA family methyltransferase